MRLYDAGGIATVARAQRCTWRNRVETRNHNFHTDKNTLHLLSSSTSLILFSEGSTDVLRLIVFLLFACHAQVAAAHRWSSLWQTRWHRSGTVLITVQEFTIHSTWMVSFQHLSAFSSAGPAVSRLLSLWLHLFSASFLFSSCFI